MNDTHIGAINSFLSMCQHDHGTKSACWCVGGTYKSHLMKVYDTLSQENLHLIELGLVTHDIEDDRLLYTQYGIDFYERLGRL